MRDHAVDFHTDIGRRHANEDAHLVDESIGFYAVADGIGGHPAGAVAARLALQEAHAEIERVCRERRGDAEVSWRAATFAVERACRRVFEQGVTDDAMRGMGTTLTMLLLDPSHTHAVVAHVGDSRLYRVRDGVVEQLTQDHSIAAELERSGILEDPLPKDSAYRHILTRAVGTHAGVVVDTLTLPVFGGDTFVLLTDGAVAAAEAGALAVATKGAHPAKAIVEAALAAGSHDNCTALVVGVHGPAPQESPRIEDMLRSIGAFSGLSQTGLLHLRNAGRRVHLHGGQSLWPALAEVSRMVLVLSGELQWEGARHGRCVVGVGDVAGLSTLCHPRIAPAELVAGEDSEVFVLTAASLQRCARLHHGLGYAAYAGLAATLAAQLDPGGSRGDVSAF